MARNIVDTLLPVALVFAGYKVLTSGKLAIGLPGVPEVNFNQAIEDIKKSLGITPGSASPTAPTPVASVTGESWQRLSISEWSVRGASAVCEASHTGAAGVRTFWVGIGPLDKPARWLGGQSVVVSQDNSPTTYRVAVDFGGSSIVAADDPGGHLDWFLWFQVWDGDRVLGSTTAWYGMSMLGAAFGGG